MGQAQINVRTRACSGTFIARTKQVALTHNVRGKELMQGMVAGKGAEEKQDKDGTVFYAETRQPIIRTGKTKCGRVFICLDGCGRVKKKKKIFLILMYHGLQNVGLLRALYTSCYCHTIYACVYFMSVNATFAVAARTRKVSRRPCTCPTTGNILILHKTLGRRTSTIILEQ